MSSQDKWIQWQERQRKKVENELAQTHPLEERRQSLKRMKQMLVSHEKEWSAALAKDLGKSPMEAYASEIAVLLNEVDSMAKHLEEWLKPEKESRLSVGMKETIQKVRLPYGSILILAPWNYPLQLALMPAIGALAAGNSCVIKPSEFAPATSHLLYELIGRYFPLERLAVIEGAEETSRTLTSMNWDFVFFTGSTQVGQKVYAAASETLTPVLLELGGKNICIVDETGDSKETVRNIVWGKYINTGQTCIAPDIVYIHASLYESYLKKAQAQIQEFYGTDPSRSMEYGRIVTKEHVDRLKAYLSEATVYSGGESNREERYLSPTILIDPDSRSKVLKEEIFGPLLVVLPYTDYEELLKQLDGQKNSLVSYLFSENKRNIDLFTQSMKSGTLSINQVVRFAGNERIPFGGVGASGFGRYHGKESIRAFTYVQPQVAYKMLRPAPFLYPPYKPAMLEGLKWLRKYFL